METTELDLLNDFQSRLDEDELKTWQTRAKKLLERQFRADKLPKPKNLRPENLRPGYVIEIGSGTGDFALQFAMANPNRQLVAMEHTRTKFKKFQDQLNKIQEDQDLSNLHAFHENAISWIAHNAGPEEVETIYLLYPNPFLKPKDWNCRWHALPFWGYLIKCLKPGGTLIVATNIREYAEECLFFNHYWNLECTLQETVGSKLSPRTKFEKKYLERNETCYNLTFTKSRL
ncbi:MAG: SAM-dependent methyltransferase [Bacteriovoracaceae bacterium]